MKKIYLFAAAALLAACSSNDLVTEQQQVSQPQGDGVPVAFDSYVNRGTTRAGLADADVVIGDLETTGVGFGVFAYYTNADNYDQSFTPNFMYNEHVTKSGGNWIYAPIKYWPNEFGNSAASDDVDKVSFFAYAPYVSVNPPSGKVNGDGVATYAADDGDITMGIVGMKKNNDTGDPMVKYISTFYTDKQVDLLWGTQTGTWTIKDDNTTQSFEAGKPWLDVKHPQVTKEKLKFDFKHALAKLNVTVDTKVNGTTPANLGESDKTKVYIRSVTFEGFDTKGALNLNSTEVDGSGKSIALWYNFDCVDELNNGAEVTIKDGRKDGREGITEATKEYAAINPNFVQSTVWDDASPKPGVTGTAANLFCTSAKAVPGVTDPILVIPNGDPLKVTIEYDVLTADPNLAKTLNDGKTPGSVVKNVITRYINTTGDGSTTPGTFILENGKTYTVSLHLGLNSVEFDAEVTAWDTPAIGGGADLPHNTAAAVAAGGSVSANIGAAGGTYNFTFTGATGAISSTSTPTGCTSAYDGTSVTITVPENTTVTNKTYNLTVSDAGTSTNVTVTINQAAAALGLTLTELSDIENDDIVLGQTATGGDWASATVSISKNGTPMTIATEYTWDSSTMTIHLVTPAVNGDIYTVTVSGMGDAASETKTVTNITTP